MLFDPRLMPISSQTVPNWSALERKILEGGYELEQCLTPTEAVARFKVRILGDRFTEAIADVFAPGSLPRGQIALWREAAFLDHPNLNRPLSVGELVVDGNQWPYFVRLRPDETLGTVLAERALTVEETREVARSITTALEFLHANGYVHGGVSPEQVLALGNSVQLSTVQLHRTNVALGPARAGARFRAPENPLENSTVEADIYCLGCALYEVLTAKKVTADAPADPVELPQPFAYIVDRCLEPDPAKRLALGAVQALLEGRQIAQPMADPEPEIHQLPSNQLPSNGMPGAEEHALKAEHLEAQPAAEPATNPEPAPASIRPVRPEPVRLREPSGGVTPFPEASAQALRSESAKPATTFSTGERIQARRQAAERTPIRPLAVSSEKPSEEAKSPNKPWMWVVLAAVLLFGLLWLSRPKGANKPQPGVSPRTDVSRATGGADIGGASHAVGPDGAGSGAHAPANTTASPTEGGRQSDHAAGGKLADERVWRVVAWTFNRESDALKRAAQVRQKHADLNPEVFSPHGHGAPYLLTLGGDMTRPEAERLRQKARAEGLPRDSYVQNYRH